MKLSIKHYLLLLLVVLATHSFAQEVPDLKAYSNDIGFNTNFLFNGIFSSNSSPFDFMLKKQKTSQTAIRYGVSIFGNKSANAYPATYYESESYYISLSIGKEKQHLISKRWIFYYGADVSPYFRFTAQDEFLQDQPLSEVTTSEFGFGASPFLGIRFQINDRLYLATQASLILSYGRKESSWKTYDGFGNLNDESSKAFNDFTIRALPAAGISVFYRY